MADVAGYSLLTGADEEDTFATLKTLLREPIESKNRGASWPTRLHGLSRAQHRGAARVAVAPPQHRHPGYHDKRHDGDLHHDPASAR